MQFREGKSDAKALFQASIAAHAAAIAVHTIGSLLFLFQIIGNELSPIIFGRWFYQNYRK